MNPHGEEGKTTLKSMNEDHKEQIQWGIDHLPDIEPKNILDIGCGGGIFTRMILEKYPDAKACAVDISELSIAHSREFNKDLIDAGRLEVAVGNVEKMPFEDGQFDLIVSNASHFFWPDLPENLKEVSRVTKDNGGVLCFTCGIHYEVRPNEMKDGFNPVADDELIGYLRAAGFETGCIPKPGTNKCAFVGTKGDFGGIREKIRHGWNLSAEGYSRNVVDTDLRGSHGPLWTELILSQAPREGKLKILDVGTGPGVFATLMAKAGHDSYGIDISDEMIEVAKRNAAEFGVSPSFKRMDSQNTDFEDETFDMIINRNVFWIMPDPMAVYEEWSRILKKGGRVVYFDGSHEKRSDDFDIIDLDRKTMLERCGDRLSFKKEDYEAARGWKKDLMLSYVARPEWDVENIAKAGFKVDSCETLENEDLYHHFPVTEEEKKDNVFQYRMFRLVATKL